MKRSLVAMRYVVGHLFVIMAALSTTMPVVADAQWETAFASVEKSRDYPVRGHSRSQVQQKHGEPEQAKSAVGQPPISSWRYPEFVVYFEHDLVITSVASEDTLPSKLENIQ